MARLKPTLLERTIKNINDKTMYGLNLDAMKPYYALVNNEDIFCEILVRLANNPNVDFYVFMQRLEFAIKELYPKMVTDSNNLSDFNNLLNIYLDNPELITEESLEKLSNAFSDKKLIYETYLYLSRPERFQDLTGVKLENIDLITEYLVKARELYVDDRALYASFINLIENKLGIDALKYGNPEQIEDAINLKLKEDRKRNGDYDIDEATIREFDRKIESMGLLSSRLNNLLEMSENERKQLSASIENVQEEMTSKRIEELRLLSEEARSKISEFNKTYLDLLQQQKRRVYDDRDTLIAEIDEYIKRKTQELELLVDKVSTDIAVEISRIKKASTDSIGTIRSYVSTDESISKLIQEANNNKALFEKIALVEELASKLDDRPIIQVAEEPETKGKRKSKVAASTNVVVPNQTIVVPVSTVDEPIDPTINYYFDSSKKFKERFKKALEVKEQLMDNGEIFHDKFDDILTMVIQNEAPYLWGPSGSGKSYLIKKQLSKVLDLKVITSGYITFEERVIGYTNAGNGDYVRSNFYRAYRLGNLVFFDEIDNSTPDATTILNPFVSIAGDESYMFPNGVEVSRHPNFRIVAAGNTRGSGRTVAHNTRKKLDEATKQRFTPVFISYDNRILDKILEDYPGWSEFTKLFRNAVAKCHLDGNNSDEPNSIGTFTSRDALVVKRHKDDDSLDDEKLIEYQIIEDKEKDYLSNIWKEMQNEKNSIQTKEGKKLMEIMERKLTLKR